MSFIWKNESYDIYFIISTKRTDISSILQITVELLRRNHLPDKYMFCTAIFLIHSCSTHSLIGMKKRVSLLMLIICSTLLFFRVWPKSRRK